MRLCIVYSIVKVYSGLLPARTPKTPTRSSRELISAGGGHAKPNPLRDLQYTVSMCCKCDSLVHFVRLPDRSSKSSYLIDLAALIALTGVGNAIALWQFGRKRFGSHDDGSMGGNGPSCLVKPDLPETNARFHSAAAGSQYNVTF